MFEVLKVNISLWQTCFTEELYVQHKASIEAQYVGGQVLLLGVKSCWVTTAGLLPHWL